MPKIKVVQIVESALLDDKGRVWIKNPIYETPTSTISLNYTWEIMDVPDEPEE